MPQSSNPFFEAVVAPSAPSLTGNPFFDDEQRDETGRLTREGVINKLGITPPVGAVPTDSPEVYVPFEGEGISPGQIVEVGADTINAGLGFMGNLLFSNPAGLAERQLAERHGEDYVAMMSDAQREALHNPLAQTNRDLEAARQESRLNMAESSDDLGGFVAAGAAADIGAVVADPLNFTGVPGAAMKSAWRRMGLADELGEAFVRGLGEYASSARNLAPADLDGTLGAMDQAIEAIAKGKTPFGFDPNPKSAADIAMRREELSRRSEAIAQLARVKAGSGHSRR